MRNLRGADPSDNRADPGQRRKDHVDHRPLHENLEGAVPIAEAMVNQAKHAVDKTENHPGDHARSQEVPRPAKKPKNGNGGKKTKDRGRRNIALEGKTLENWNLIGDDQPGRKNQTEANSGIHAGANGGIGKKIQAARPGQICSNEHSEAGLLRAD